MASHHRLQGITDHLVGANTAGSVGAYGPVGTKRDSDVVSETPRAAAPPLRPPLLTRAVVFSFYFSFRVCVACCLSFVNLLGTPLLFSPSRPLVDCERRSLSQLSVPLSAKPEKLSETLRRTPF